MSCNNFSLEQKETAEQIIETYARFGVKIGELISVAEGARVSRFEFSLLPDTKISKITMLRDDISLMLSVPKVRIICPIPHKTAFAIEIPNKTQRFVELDEVFDSKVFKTSQDKLCIALGKNLANEDICLELSKAPHLLIGGGMFSGKTTLLKSIICSLIFNNPSSDVKLLLMAPQRDELSLFETSKHLFSPVICDKAVAIEALNNLFCECEKRLKSFAENSVKNIDAYNDIAEEKLPKIVAIIDEFSFLTEHNLRDFETVISRLAQFGRMAGIHIILATKDLTAKTVTGIIKANIPTRIALSAQNAMESRTIMDACDAECLLSKGDLLLSNSPILKPQRIQAAFITDEQINNNI